MTLTLLTTRRTSLAPVLLFVGLVLGSQAADAAPSSLAEAELEISSDEAFTEGEKLGRAASCIRNPATVALASKAYNDANKALQVKNSSALNAAFARGLKTSRAASLDFEECMQTAMWEGRKAMLRGAAAAAVALDKSMLPATMGRSGKTLGGVLVYAQTTFVLPVAWCIKDDTARSTLSEDYVDAMQQFIDNRNFKADPDNPSFYPFEQTDPEHKPKVGLKAGDPSCAELMFKAGMATEMFRKLNNLDDDTRGKWLFKRLHGL